MWRTASYYARVLYNFFRLFFWSLLNGFKIKYKGAQKLSSKSKLSVGKKGRITLGGRCMAEEGVLLHAPSGKITLGTKVFINRNSTIVSHESIDIGSYTTIGPNVCIYDHDHDTENWKQFISKPVSIGENVWVGANVVILKGVQIGDNAVIGAGTVVSKSIPADHVCYNSSQTLVIKEKKSKR